MDDETLQGLTKLALANVMKVFGMYMDRGDGDGAMGILYTLTTTMLASVQGQSRKIVQDRINEIMEAMGTDSFEDYEDLIAALKERIPEVVKVEEK